MSYLPLQIAVIRSVRHPDKSTEPNQIRLYSPDTNYKIASPTIYAIGTNITFKTFQKQIRRHNKSYQ